MNPCPANVARLSLLVQRTLDAEVLDDTDSAALLGAAEAVRRSLEEGDVPTAKTNRQAFIHQVNALVQTGQLTPAQGKTLTDAARALLARL
jgi:hypothetical protein